MSYQSLYRRYRPQTFGDIVGQEHVTNALRNAVRDDRVGHAYLFSGPRGTGKTTAARVLAKVLNCENPVDGEPDGICPSCIAIETGTSFDLHELDAASNNKVEDVRELLKKVALGTPGRRKVYLLDEVHMLSSGAENALLKTLEEPPDHVVFVLATTEPHKVVTTIRSRTQHFELTLIPADKMAERVREIAADAQIEVTSEIVGHVVKAGGGSARDTLSALDQVIAAGGVADVDTSTPDLLEAVASQDPALALRAIEDATSRGMDPRRVGEVFIDSLRSVFLLKMGAPPARLSDPERELSEVFVERLSAGTLTRVLELVGSSLVEMRQAPDPRIDLEVAFVKSCSPRSDGSIEGLSSRLDQLESRVDAGQSGLPAPTPAPTVPQATQADAAAVPEPAVVEPATTAGTQGSSPVAKRRPADAARAVLKSQEGTSQPTADSAPRAQRAAPPKRSGQSAPPVPPSMRSDVEAEAAAPAAGAVAQTAEAPTPEAVAPEPAGAVDHSAGATKEEPATESSGSVTAAEVQDRWAAMLDGQSTPARARFLAGRVAGVDGDVIDFVLPTDSQVKRCESFRVEVEKAATETFGMPLRIVLRAGTDGPKAATGSQVDAAPVQDESEIDVTDLTDADAMNATVVDRIADVFPGAEVLDQES